VKSDADALAPSSLDALIAVAAWLLRALLVVSLLGAAIACREVMA
jgi:hypothetical protein